MKLDQWMGLTKTSDENMAAAVEVDRSTISRVRRGRTIPSPQLIEKIFQHTHGAVQPNDFFNRGVNTHRELVDDVHNGGGKSSELKVRVTRKL